MENVSLLCRPGKCCVSIVSNRVSEVPYEEARLEWVAGSWIAGDFPHDQQRETYFSERHRQRMAGSSPAMTIGWECERCVNPIATSAKRVAFDQLDRAFALDVDETQRATPAPVANAVPRRRAGDHGAGTRHGGDVRRGIHGVTPPTAGFPAYAAIGCTHFSSWPGLTRPSSDDVARRSTSRVVDHEEVACNPRARKRMAGSSPAMTIGWECERCVNPIATLSEARGIRSTRSGLCP